VKYVSRRYFEYSNGKGGLRRTLMLLLAATAVAGLVAEIASAQESPVSAGNSPDWHQWRGPQRNGVSSETAWQAEWPAGGPKQLWQKVIGSGFSTVSVADGRVFTMGNDGEQDTIWCLDADTGAEIWKHSYPCRKGEHPGPRATPTVDGKVVYTISRQSDVHCLEAATGKPIWSKNLAKELGAKVAGWGIASSPLVVGDLLILNVGTAGAALNKATGKVVWQTGKGASGYASPVRFDMGDRRCVLIFAAKGLACVNLEDGQRLWWLPWKTNYNVNAADPIVVGNTIFISSGYGAGCALLKVEGGKPSIVWRNRRMKNHFSSCVLYEGHLYGSDGNAGGAVVKCIGFATGDLKWTSPKLGMASLMLAGDRLIIQGDQGKLIVAEATPSAFKPISQATVLAGQCWTPPVLSNGRIYCRNTGRGRREGRLICLDVKAQ